MLKKQKEIQAISETLLPLLGFFFFDWGLYFILLYYFIELLANELFVQLKIGKIKSFNPKAITIKKQIGYSLLHLVLIVLIILGASYASKQITPSLNFQQEIISFLAYEEAGIPIPQGFIILPLVLLGNFQLYKMNFLMRGLYRIIPPIQLYQSRRRALVIAFLGCVLGIVLTYFFVLNEVLLLLLMVLGKLIVDLKLTKE